MGARSDLDLDKAPDSAVSGGSLGKALLVLGKFIDGQDAWGVRELAGALDQPSSSVHRMLKIMRTYRLIEWEPTTQKYRTGPELHRWASILRTRTKLPELIRPVAQALTDQLRESTWFALYDRDGQRIWYALEVECTRPLRFAAPIGGRERLSESPAGLAVLAHLDAQTQRLEVETANGDLREKLVQVLADTRRLGFVVSEDVGDEAPILIAAPVFDAANSPIGSLIVTVPRHRFHSLEVGELTAPLLDATKRVSGILGARLLTGSEEASTYRGIAAIASVLKERLSPLHLTPWERGGSLKLNELQKHHAAYGTAVGSDLEAAYHGMPPFDVPHDHLRLVMGLAPLQLHILVAEDIEITSIADLARLRVSAGERDYATAQTFLKLMGLAMFNERQIEKAGGRLAYLGYNEATRLFEEGKIDVLVSLNAVPNPSYLKLARRRAFKLVGIERPTLDAFIKKNPTFQCSEISAASYPGQTTDVATLAAPFVIVTTDQRPDKEVYDFVESVHERRLDLAAVSPAFESLATARELTFMRVPLHPGAAHFYSTTVATDEG